MAMSLQDIDWLIDQLKCFKCKEYLLCPPIVQLENGNSVCGNCTPPFPSTNHDGTLTRQLDLEYFLKKISFPCIYSGEGCTERLHYGSKDHVPEKCVFRLIPCPVEKCPWTMSMFSLPKHIGHNHFSLVRRDIDFKIEVNKNSKGTMMVIIDKVPIMVNYSYKGIESEFFLQVHCLTLDSANYKLWMFNDSDNDYSVCLEHKACVPYVCLSNTEEKLNLGKYLDALENPERVRINLGIIIDKGDENEVAPPMPCSPFYGHLQRYGGWILPKIPLPRPN